MEAVEDLTVDGNVDDHVAEAARVLLHRDRGTGDQLDVAAAFRGRGRDRADERAGGCRQPYRNAVRYRDMTPLAGARERRCPLGGRHEDDRQPAVLRARVAAIPLHARYSLAGGCRIPPDILRRRRGREPGVGDHIVVAVFEEVRADVGRDHQRAESEEGDDQQRRHDADEDVGQDQLAAHTPQQPPLHQQEEPPHEIADRHDQPDRRGAAQQLDRPGHSRHAAQDGDEELQPGGDDEQAAGPGVEQEIDRRGREIRRRRRLGGKLRQRPSTLSRYSRESGARHVGYWPNDNIPAVKLSGREHFSTVCIHAGQEPDPGTGAIITPIFQTSTYVQEAFGKHKGYEYARTQNPTRAALEANLAAIERGKAGFAFASGMAAIGAVATLLQSGDHVIVTDNTYGGTFRLFDKVLRRYQLEFSYVDTSQPELIEQALRPNTRLLFVETPTNPVMRLTDLARAAEIARKANVRMVVDNTFASPYVQRPLELGADMVVHSTTKYLNGHSDSIGGIVVATRDDDIEWLGFVQNAEGAILSPMDSWLVLRGTKTLAVRMAQHNKNGLAHRRVPGVAPEGPARALPRPADAPAARAGEAADERLRRDAVVRRRDLRRREARAEPRPAHGARGEPGRGRDADLTPGVDDARLGARRTASGHGAHRQPGADLGGDRRRRTTSSRT